MRFRSHTLVTRGTDFFDLMAQQMRGVHSPEEKYDHANKTLNDAIGKLHEVCDDRSAIHEVDDAVGGCLALAEDVEYKNGFADAICMILQAAMHRD